MLIIIVEICSFPKTSRSSVSITAGARCRGVCLPPGQRFLEGVLESALGIIGKFANICMESKQLRKVFGMRLIVMLGLFLSFGTVYPACERLCSKEFWTSASLDKMKTELACQGDVNMVNVQDNSMLHSTAFYGGRDHVEA